MATSKKTKKNVSELRRDPVSRDWVVIATGRAKRPNMFAGHRQRDPVYESLQACPFEDLAASGNTTPFLVFDRDAKRTSKPTRNWFVQVIQNKFPAFGGISTHRHATYVGPYIVLDGSGSHEIVVMRDHTRSFAQFTRKETEVVIRAYLARFRFLSRQVGVHYVSIFHNFGKEAGASLFHPHSQIIGIPVVPPDIARSLAGSHRYFEDNGRCVHCEMIEWEKKDGKRIVFENGYFIAFCPFVSRAAFEVRIFPKSHEPAFDEIGEEEIAEFAEALRSVFQKIYRALGDPAYNFFIHTSPINIEHEDTHYYPHYHWHVEILPKTAIWAGFELGTGIEISTLEPEKAARFLRRFAA